MNKLSQWIVAGLAFVSLSVAAEDVVENIKGQIVINNGVPTYSLPIDLPGGIHGLKPEMSVQYSGNVAATNLGSGFVLQAVSSISRCTASIRKDNYFAGLEQNSASRFCLGGQKLVAINDTNNGEADSEYRLYKDSNHKIIAVGGTNNTPHKWEHYTPDGYKMVYEKVGNFSNISSEWLLVSKSDFFGNVITYTYSDDNNSFLKSISYSGITVSINYRDSAYNVTGYTGGVLRNLDKKVSNVQVSYGNKIYYQYKFGYELAVAGNRTELLKTIEKCYGDNLTLCTEPLTFDYKDQPLNPTIHDAPEDRTIVIPRDVYVPAGTNEGNLKPWDKPSYAAADLNNDGFPEFCYYKLDQGIVCAEGSESSYSAPQVWLSSNSFGYDNGEDDYKYFSYLRMIDLNNDAKTDVCIVDDGGVKCALNNGTQFGTATYWNEHLNDESFVSFENISNDDGKPEICGYDSETNIYSCYKNTGASATNLMFSLTAPGDYHVEAKWRWENIDSETGETAATGSESKEMSYVSAFWIDVDGDLDRDICWVNHTKELMCQKSSYSESNDIVFSESQLVMTFNHLPDFHSEITRAINNSGTEITVGNKFVSDAMEDNFKDVKKAVGKFKTSFRMADVNGDALADICYQNGNDFVCHKNTGAGFTSASTWVNLNSVSTNEEAQKIFLSSIQMSDVNFDGLPDICYINSEFRYCGLNEGSNFATPTAVQSISADIDYTVVEDSWFNNHVQKMFDSKTSWHAGYLSFAYGIPVQTTDINGDGNSEFCYRSIHGVMCSDVEAFAPAAQLVSVTDSNGLKTDIEYGAYLTDGLYDATRSVPSNTEKLLNNRQLVAAVVSETGAFSGNDPIRNRIEYRYGHFVSNVENHISGFDTIEVRNVDRNMRTVSQYYLEPELSGQEKNVWQYIGGTLLNHKFNDIEVKNTNWDTKRVQVNSQSESQYDLNGQLHLTTVTGDKLFDEYGFVLSQKLTKTLATGEQLSTVTTNTFQNDLDNWLLGRPLTNSAEHSDGIHSSVSRSVKYIYDNGLLTREELQPDSDKPKVIEYVYFANGLVDRVSTTAGDKTRYTDKTYDALGRVLTKTDMLGNIETYTYDGLCGAKTYEDIAGLIITTDYNQQCQKTLQTNNRDDNQTTWNISLVDDSSYYVNRDKLTATNVKNKVAYKLVETSATGGQAITYFDVLGRKIREQSKALAPEGATRYSSVDTIFDRYGRSVAVSNPHFETNGHPETAAWTTLTYDELDRVSTETKPGADGNPFVISFSYTANQVQQTYADFDKTTTNGVHGKPVTVTENGLTVSYTYDPIGNLKTTDRSGLVITLDYDEHGNKVSQEDPTLGTWTYGYNAFGELISQTDNKQQVATFTYDDLGRKATESRLEGTTTWKYYLSGNGIGQLEFVKTGDNITRSYTYDANGRVRTSTFKAEDKELTTTYVYDDYSRLVTTQYPNGFSTSNQYDAIGNPQAVTIPSDQFRDYSYDGIITEYIALINNVVDLESQIAALDKQAQYHLSKHLEYKQAVEYFEGLKDKVENDIAALEAAALEHEQRAKELRQKAQDVREQAANLKALFGDRSFKYKGKTSDGQAYHFQAKWCSKKATRWGVRRCTRTKTRDVTISSLELNPTDTDHSIKYLNFEPKCTRKPYRRFGAVKKVKKKCTHVVPHQLYTDVANQWQKLADAAEKEANAARDLINKPANYKILKPVYFAYDTWVFVGAGVLTPIPVYATGWNKEWVSASPAEALVYYNQQIAYYENLAAQSKTSHNGLIDQIGNLMTDLQEAQADKSAFEQTLGDMDMDLEQLQTMIQKREEWESSGKNLVVWMATSYTPAGQLKGELFGNGLISNRVFDADSGALKTIQTGSHSGILLRNLEYEYNSRGLISAKWDDSISANTQYENFTYDSLGRLTTWTFDQTVTRAGESVNRNLQRQYDYDDWGNITAKTGAGTFIYDPTTGRLNSRSINGGNVSYQYDDNGNFTNADGRTYNWNSFNKITSVTKAAGVDTPAATVSYKYDGNQRRAVKTTSTDKTYYIAPGYELVVNTDDDEGESIKHRYNIWSGNDVVATYVKHEFTEDDGSGNTVDTVFNDQIAYYHRDIIGSGELVTGSDMQILSQRYYTPYGESIDDVSPLPELIVDEIVEDTETVELTEEELSQAKDHIQNTNTTALLSEIQSSRSEFDDTLRGYTSQENIPEVGLVNMNARHYDPVIARFVSADTIIPGIDQPLAYNRYAYVNGNPISSRDPSGHSALSSLGAIAGAAFSSVFLPGFIVFGPFLTDDPLIQKAAQVAMTVAISAALSPAAGAAFGAAAGSMVAAGASNLITTAFITGRITNEDGRAAAWSAVSAGITYGIGHGDDGATLFDTAGTYTAHTIAQGTLAHLQGGSFIQGAASGLVGHATGDVTKASRSYFHNSAMDTVFGRTMVAASLGYLSSAALGGNGTDGAMSAAIVHLFNNEAGRARTRSTGGRILSPDEASAALEDVKNKLGVAPEGLIEGKNGAMKYNPADIIEIVDALNTLVVAHGEGYTLYTDPYMGPERTMLMRVILGKGDLYTVGWFRHEVSEAGLLRGKSNLSGPLYLLAQEEAHILVQNEQRNSSVDIYHPSVVRAYDSQFGPAFPRY